MLQQLLEKIHARLINMTSTVNQLNYMKKMLTVSSSEEAIKETENELKRLCRFYDTTVLAPSMFPFGTQYVYVWELEQGKYYIGWSENLSRRLDEHLSEEGALWTKKYKPVAIIEILRGDKEVEKQKTLEYIKLKGFDNVRGAGWCSTEYKTVPRGVKQYIDSIT